MKLTMYLFGLLLAAIGLSVVALATYINLTSKEFMFMESLVAAIVGFIILVFGGFISGRTEGVTWVTFLFSIIVMVVGLGMTLGGIIFLFFSDNDFLFKFFQSLATMLFGLIVMGYGVTFLSRSLKAMKPTKPN